MPLSSDPAGVFAIETRGLSKHFGRHTAVDGLTMRVPAGAIAGFIGPNGAGKTTTIRLLLGLVRQDAGSPTVLGHSLTEFERYLPRVGALVEAPAFYPGLSGRTNLEVLARLGGHPGSRVSELLEVVGLSDRARDRVGTYSLGMKQRPGVAMALPPDPDLLILDEPANGLDPLGIIEIREMLRRLAGQGKTILLILVVEGIIAVVLPQVTQWFPGRVFNTIGGTTVPLVGPTPPQGYPAALGAALLWIVGFVVVSAVVFSRQDVKA
ncbi:ATP-binding cassette domain-containing protein [Arthrobacter sp. efr-133-R2A-120]|uniref:ABC transporter ATP-binding protein n=1 Tax=Arthrobacter sp. efr-133-R2A-120 TaxID=3040277 RepID=UPI00254DAF29|nr:ATP-binding cassette domain-containing protein [Arthrobacter sp. efr-133-R2A-120]